MSSEEKPVLGEDAKWCGARKRDGSGTCRRPAGWKTKHSGIGRCGLHGGATASHQQAADKVILDREARKILAELNVEPQGDPLSVLATLLGQAVAFKDAVAERLNALNEIRFLDAKGTENARTELLLWERALDRCEKFATSMARLNIDERLAAITERQAALVAEALTAVMTEMGMSHEQQREARTRVARHLRVIPGKSA